MPTKRRSDLALEFHPLTYDRWADFETLFGVRGACGGCWCMSWRLTRTEFDRQKGEENKESMRRLVESGVIPGILAYADGVPVGWCAVEPRESYPRLEKSRVLKRVDDRPIWAVTCLFVKKDQRNKGVSIQLLRAAVDYVKEQGGTVVEGYPVETRMDRLPDAFAWTGLVSAFEQAGYVEHRRGSPSRPIMRFETEKKVQTKRARPPR